MGFFNIGVWENFVVGNYLKVLYDVVVKVLGVDLVFIVVVGEFLVVVCFEFYFVEF